MSTLKAMIVPVTPFQQNCAILWDEETRRGAVSDPGGDVDAILKAVEKSGIAIEKILLTHGHIDHAGAAADLAERLGVKIEGPHTEDLFLLEDLPRSGAQYGMTGVRPVTPDRWLKEGDSVTVSGLSFEILETPGHTPGSVVFFERANRFRAERGLHDDRDGVDHQVRVRPDDDQTSAHVRDRHERHEELADPRDRLQSAQDDDRGQDDSSRLAAVLDRHVLEAGGRDADARGRAGLRRGHPVPRPGRQGHHEGSDGGGGGRRPRHEPLIRRRGCRVEWG